MPGKAQITDQSAFEQKSLGMQVGLTVVTLGLYPLYWFYSTAQQFDQGTDRDLTPIFGIIPVLNFVCAWQIADAAESVTDQDKEILFLLFLVFGVVSWYWVQSGINGIAEG